MPSTRASAAGELERVGRGAGDGAARAGEGGQRHRPPAPRRSAADAARTPLRPRAPARPAASPRWCGPRAARRRPPSRPPPGSRRRARRARSRRSRAGPRRGRPGPRPRTPASRSAAASAVPSRPAPTTPMRKRQARPTGVGEAVAGRVHTPAGPLRRPVAAGTSKDTRACCRRPRSLGLGHAVTQRRGAPRGPGRALPRSLGLRALPASPEPHQGGVRSRATPTPT